jgi:hypothetical protein
VPSADASSCKSYTRGRLLAHVGSKYQDTGLNLIRMEECVLHLTTKGEHFAKDMNSKE